MHRRRCLRHWFFGAILKWEDAADEPHANRWIILIAYLMGLSIGVHLLNLLAIPAIVFVYYFRKYKVTRNGVLISLAVSLLILGVVMYGIIPGVITMATWFELMFVNGLGLPFNTGVIIYSLALIGALVFGILYTVRKKTCSLEYCFNQCNCYPDWLFFVCHDCNPFVSKSADGSEQSG